MVERVETKQHEAWLRRVSALVSPTQRAQAYVQESNLATADDLCLYLQGGPGFGAPAPVAQLGLETARSSWAAHALHTNLYAKIVLLDQRGTGKSSPVTKQVLQRNFPNLFVLDDIVAKNASSSDSTSTLEQTESLLQSLQPEHPEETALVQTAIHEVTEYLSCFRADSIVQDAELVRQALLAPPTFDDDDNSKDKKDDDKNNNKDKTDETTTPKPWGCALGQSYGGFCLLTYLSQVSHPPQVALFTGGLAPILTPLHEVYTRLWHRVRRRSLLYYDMYPGDVRLVKRMVQRLIHQPISLPSGGFLTARRFLQLGLGYLGSSPSSFAALHHVVSTALLWDDDNIDVTELEFTKAFLKSMDASQGFEGHPIYFWMHESIYANGGPLSSSSGTAAANNCPTAWAAHRAYQDLVETHPEIWDYRTTSRALDDDTVPTLWFGEMVFPWMADGDYAEVSGFGVQSVAHAIAAKTDWTPLWNTDHMRHVLESGTSRAAAAVYYDDFYVDFDCSMKLLQDNGPLARGCHVYVTNEYQHSGLRDDGAKIFAKLHGMALGHVRVPS